MLTPPPDWSGLSSQGCAPDCDSSASTHDNYLEHIIISNTVLLFAGELFEDDLEWHDGIITLSKYHD